MSTMAADVTPARVEEQLAWLSRALDLAQQELVEADERATRLVHRAKVAFAKAFLEAAGSMDMRRQIATVETDLAVLDADLAEQQVRAVKEKLRVLNAKVDIARSLGAGLRAGWSAA